MDKCTLIMAGGIGHYGGGRYGGGHYGGGRYGTLTLTLTLTAASGTHYCISDKSHSWLANSSPLEVTRVPL